MGGVVMIKVKDCWDQLSSRVQQKIVSHHPHVSGDSSRKELTDPLYWESYLKELNRDEKAVVHWMALERGEVGLSFRDLRGNDLPLRPVPFRVALTRLRQRGVVYAVRQKWGETFYIIPGDIREAWLKSVLTDATAPAENVEVTALAPPGSVHDLFHLMVMIDRDGLPLTEKGDVRRRAAQKMDVELETEGEAFADARWINRNGGPTGFHIVFQIAEWCGLLTAETGRWALKRQALDTWLTMSYKGAAAYVYQQVKRALLQENPRLAAVLWWMEQQSEWVSVRDMALMWLQKTEKPERNWKALADAWMKTCLRPFHSLGWIDWGECLSGTAWRWSVFSPFVEGKDAVEQRWFVQPNFEWLIPFNFPLDLRWKAAQFADLVQTDRLCTYVLSGDSVKRGLAKGWTAEDIVQFLKRYSAVPLPQNVVASIRQWEKNLIGPVRLERVLLMSCEDEHIARQLSTDPSIGPSFRRRLGGRHFVVDEQSAGRLVRQLEAAGYPPFTIERSGAAEDASSQPVAGDKKHRLQVENRYPELTEAVPGLERLPKLWTSTMRLYHPSTLIKLVERAVEMQLELEWRRPRSDRCDILRPIRVFNTDGVWKVEGLDQKEEAKEIELQHIGEVRIRVPELT